MRLIDADEMAANESEAYISAQVKVKSDITRRINEVVHLKIQMLIADTPTVDAVTVVRCRDCKWYKEGELLAPNKFCFRLKHPKEDRKIGYNYSPDDFCSYGERRTDHD